MKKTIFLSAAALCCSMLYGSMLGNADFESGNLNNWECRQQQFGSVQLFQTVPGGNNKTAGKYHLKSCGDKNNEYNQFITLVQKIKTTPYADKKYIFGGFAQANVKSPGGKYVKLSIREIDASGKTVLYQDIPVDIHSEPYALYEKIITPTNKTHSLEFYITLINLEETDTVFFDNLFFSEFSNEKAFDPQKKSVAAETLTLESDGFSARINAQSGLLDSLASNGENIHPSALDNHVVFVRLSGNTYAFKCGENKYYFVTT